jgi:hypothetical protein
MNFKFRQTKWVELLAVEEYQAKAGRWMAEREAEHSRLLGVLAECAAGGGSENAARPRYFVLEERGVIQAAGLLTATGEFHCTWATSAMVAAMVERLAAAECVSAGVRSQAFTAWDFANAWSDRKHVPWRADFEERAYQLDRRTHIPPASGAARVSGGRGLGRDVGVGTGIGYEA